VSESAPPPSLYRVIYSERVRESLRELGSRAKERGLRDQVLDAVKEIDRLLHVYPQFGDPLIDLTQEPGQIWIATIPPLVVHYVIYDEQRLVMVAIPLRPLPGSGL
jgi:hypothetical protein